MKNNRLMFSVMIAFLVTAVGFAIGVATREPPILASTLTTPGIGLQYNGFPAQPEVGPLLSLEEAQRRTIFPIRTFPRPPVGLRVVGVRVWEPGEGTYKGQNFTWQMVALLYWIRPLNSNTTIEEVRQTGGIMLLESIAPGENSTEPWKEIFTNPAAEVTWLFGSPAALVRGETNIVFIWKSGMLYQVAAKLPLDELVELARQLV